METDIKSYLESLLFVSGESVSFLKLGKIIGEGEDCVKEKILELSEDYKNRGSGIRIAVQDGRAQMVTAGENADVVEKLMKLDIEGDLSRPALETISIIAYRGPLSRAEIEEIRGVNTSFTLRQLSIRGLIEKIDNPKDARAYLYKISFDFLRHLGIEKMEDLPRYQELRQRELISEQIIKNSEEDMKDEGGGGEIQEDGLDDEEMESPDGENNAGKIIKL